MIVAETKVTENCKACGKSFPIPNWMLQLVYDRNEGTVHTCKNRACKHRFYLHAEYAAAKLGKPVKEQKS